MVIYEPFETKPLSDFHDELKFEFPSLPFQLFDHYLISAARQMAEEGNLIRRKAYIRLQPCVTRYRLDVPDDTELVGIIRMRQFEDCGCFDHSVRRAFVPPVSQPWGGAESWYDDSEDVLHIETPFAGGVEVTISVRPKRDACSLPVEYYDDFMPALMAGVKSKIMMITGRPWTNMRLGAAYASEFKKAIADAAVQVATHKQRGRIKMGFGRAM